MVRFYWKTLREAPGIALRAAHGWFTLAILAACVVVTFSRGAASALTAPSLFALIPIGLFFLYGLLRANFEHYRRLDKQNRELAAEAERLRQAPPPQRVIHERKRDPFEAIYSPQVQPFNTERWNRQDDERRAKQGRILNRLHAEYLEEHPDAPRRVRLKTAPLPREWVTTRLKEMGEWESDVEWGLYGDFWPP